MVPSFTDPSPLLLKIIDDLATLGGHFPFINHKALFIIVETWNPLFFKKNILSLLAPR